MTVSANQQEAQYPCFMPEWLATDRTSRMVVHGVGAVKDPAGKERMIMTPANARITMILEGALLKVAHAADELTVTAGDSFDIPIRLSRSAKLQTGVTVSIQPPRELRDLIEAKELNLPAHESTGMVQIQTISDPKLTGRWNLLIKATTMQAEKWPVVSQTEVEVDFVP